MQRAIDHPCFRNISNAEALRLMQSKLPGEVIFRPSSKGEDHLTLTWKVVGDCLEHIDIREQVRARAAGRLN